VRGKRIEEKVDQVAQLLQRVDAGIIVRDPATAYAAEAYEGLRKHVQFASQQQRIHLSTLIGLLDDIAAGATLETLTLRIRDRLSESGVTEVLDPESLPEAFGEIDSSRETRPAWVLVSTEGRVNVIRPGTCHPKPAAVSDGEEQLSLGANNQEPGELEPDGVTTDPTVAGQDDLEKRGE
jgi:hypothetical protein